MFRAYCFAVLDCGFVPRCALEIKDGTQFRLHNIINLIKESQYGIHDLSKVDMDDATKLPRFNMPFELGIFYGAKFLWQNHHRKKCCLILEKEKYRYRKFISDISGQDISAHQDTFKQGIHAIRNWLVTASRRKSIPSAEDMYDRYRKFDREIRKLCKDHGRDYSKMPFVELTKNMSDWLKKNQSFPPALFN